MRVPQGRMFRFVYLCGAGSVIFEDENDSPSKNLDAFGDGTCAMHAYRFEYDRRVDPFEMAEHLNEYIEAAKETTHSDKVNSLSLPRR